MATWVKCDNPRCTAEYEMSSFLGGHTFTCNQCGSRVTIRDLSYEQPRQAQPRIWHPRPGSDLLGLVPKPSRWRSVLKWAAVLAIILALYFLTRSGGFLVN